MFTYQPSFVYDAYLSQCNFFSVILHFTFFQEPSDTEQSLFFRDFSLFSNFFHRKSFLGCGKSLIHVACLEADILSIDY